ncbi:hypothetical protein RHSIM_Rhsim05G0056300 [Rhododendron simsii]|uniref:PGG domain-containing protein n=1 Tax=Rhododendron simsii TaxID=118357 RepID=A0A834GWE7_RHOSS|nr:hypothetical protein RHSIM_Rhsim05G0056300 [Rhododendron simsii]
MLINKEKKRSGKRGKKQKNGNKIKILKIKKDALGAIVIVASLMATITLAAAFAIPGGYDGYQGRDQGMAVLAKAPAFKAFLITNTIAMVCSVTSVFLCLVALNYAEGEENHDHFENRGAAAFALILVSMFAVMLALIAATFAVLAHSIALAVFTCVIACTSFIVYFLELKMVFFLQIMIDSSMKRVKHTVFRPSACGL